jgi:two-component system, cell cycle sensor histidine kinase and response regulator CckA
MDTQLHQIPDRRGALRPSPTVLLVEDVTALREALVRQLQSGDYRVIPAASGHEALAILRKEGGTIDLLLTDVMMPGLLGPELVAVTRHRWPGVGCLYMTGGADDRAVNMIRDSRIPSLKKPFTSGELREAVETALRKANLQVDGGMF